MNVFPGCPAESTKQENYYCRLLDTMRNSKEEEICSLCANLLEKSHHFSRLDKVIRYAAAAHSEQMRKGTKIPYFIHLVRTWHYVQQMTSDMDEWEAAFLHDTLEDTPVTWNELKENFGERVAALVLSESEEKRGDRPASETWELRKLETIRRLYDDMSDNRKIPSMRIAFGDKLANLFSMAFEYRQVGEALWDKFNQKDKFMHGWYYGEMGYVFEKIFSFDYPELVSEYWNYYEEVFGKYEVSGKK